MMGGSNNETDQGVDKGCMTLTQDHRTRSHRSDLSELDIDLSSQYRVRTYSNAHWCCKDCTTRSAPRKGYIHSAWHDNDKE